MKVNHIDNLDDTDEKELYTSILVQSQYGLSPYDIISHNTTPYDQTSDAVVNLLNWIASGAVQRTGIFPPLKIGDDALE